MADRFAHWSHWEQRDRDHRAAKWREARTILEGHAPVTRRALLEYWNGHRWLPGDPSYLLDLLHGFERGRYLIENGRLRPAVVTIPVSAAVAAFGPPKPMARAWLGKPAPKPDDHFRMSADAHGGTPSPS